MTFCPEWLTGNKNLRTDNFLYFWVYLMVRKSAIDSCQSTILIVRILNGYTVDESAVSNRC